MWEKFGYVLKSNMGVASTDQSVEGHLRVGGKILANAGVHFSLSICELFL
jgi:hypothetical protein